MTLFHTDYENVIRTKCLAHILNLVVKEGLKVTERSISDISKVVKFINLSPKKKLFYFDACRQLNIPELALIQDTPIRWNSTYLMLERASKMKAVLDHICKENRDNKDYIIQNWDEIDVFIPFLKPFYDATLLLSTTKYPSILYVVPIVDFIQNQILMETNNVLKEKCSPANVY